MARITISSSDPNVFGCAYLNIIKGEIIDGYWAIHPDSDVRLTEAKLEDTVYFITKTKGMPDGASLKMKLWDDDGYFNPDDDKFGNEKVEYTVEVCGNKAVLELLLHPSWAKMIKSDVGAQIELYWSVSSKTQTVDLPKKKKDYLNVGYSDRDLYIKPSEVDPLFPEMYSFAGELIAPGFMSATSVANQSADKWADKLLNRMVLMKLKKGYLMTSNGTVYQRKSVTPQTYEKFDGTSIKVEQGRNLGFRTRQGDKLVKVTSKGVNQYEAFSRIQAEKIGVKAVKALKHVGSVFDLSSILSFGMNGRGDDLPPLPGILSPLNLTLEQYLESVDEFMEGSALESLERAKMDGVQAVEKFVWSAEGKKYKFRMSEVSVDVATQLRMGEIRKMKELEDSSSSEVRVLYRQKQHPITGLSIYIVETIFFDI